MKSSYTMLADLKHFTVKSIFDDEGSEQYLCGSFEVNKTTDTIDFCEEYLNFQNELNTIVTDHALKSCEWWLLGWPLGKHRWHCAGKIIVKIFDAEDKQVLKVSGIRENINDVINSALNSVGNTGRLIVKLFLKEAVKSKE